MTKPTYVKAVLKKVIMMATDLAYFQITILGRKDIVVVAIMNL
jgi:hypothetical protein